MTSPVRTRSPSPPRELPTAERDRYGDDCLVEEEMFDWYDPDEWYPVKIGDVFESRYQVLVKLGFGSVSTAWLCRDLRFVPTDVSHCWRIVAYKAVESTSTSLSRCT